MKLSIKLNKNSSFNSEEHFIDCLRDLIEEWEDCVGPKEMDIDDVGFNCERLTELKKGLTK